MTIAQDLVEGRAAIGVVGLGFIGTSTAMAYASAGVKVVGCDIDSKKVERYQRGICDVVNLEAWSGMRLKPLVDSGMIRVTTRIEDLKDCPVVFVAVPTEKSGKPYQGYIRSVLSKLGELMIPLIVIESTLGPRWYDEMGLRDRAEVVIAPRRDWFSDVNWNLKSMPRIWWASPEASYQAEPVLSIVCTKLIKAPDPKSASLTKAVENAMLHAEIALAQQLVQEFVPQGIDVNWVMKAVGTHPRMPTRYPGIKASGYCVPMASLYLEEGSTRMTISAEATRANRAMVMDVFNAVKKFDTVGILGITYKNDLKVHTLSAAQDFRLLMSDAARGQKVQAQDPYYTDEEIRQVLGCEPFIYPEHLNRFDCLLVLTDHRQYAQTPLWVLKKELRKDVAIVDGLGVWERHREHFPGYRRFGTDRLEW